MTDITFHEPPKTFYKDPDEVLSWTIDWTQWLKTDTISSSDWTVPAGLTKDSDTNTTTSTTITLSDGLHGVRYAVVNKVTTAAGLEKEKVIYIKVLDNRNSRLAV